MLTTARISKSSRDVQNEKPRNLTERKNTEKKVAETGTSAIIHTSYGDIHVRLFPDVAPKAVENFVTHARNGYYNNIIFHRVIRKFMIQVRRNEDKKFMLIARQTGDPLGDGTGGESIWGREFEDEFSSLKHDHPYTLSMANAGLNTNGSQFFITTEKTVSLKLPCTVVGQSNARQPWLDNKHTIFGRAIQGMDVVHQIENAKVYKEKPEADIKIINITVR
jgi:peptidylprolyl isomerase domain and WD repeat-containing protein 1